MARAESDPFAVRGVKIDVTAANAVTAREQAFEQAQAKAFDVLVDRLTSADERDAIAPPESDMLAAMVNDFEITEEQLSAVRYIGTYTFRFKQDAVRHYLAGYGLSYSDVESKPVLILPFYQWGARTLLWEPENPWREAWNRSSGAQGLVPTAVPLGDLEDEQAIEGDTMMRYDAAALAGMADRYKAGSVLMVLAVPLYRADAPDNSIASLQSLKLSLYQAQDGALVFIKDISITPDDNETVDSLFEKAIWAVNKELQQSWKEQTKVSASEHNSLRARVRFQSMNEWVDTQKVLRQVQGVTDVKLLSLKPGEAQIELAFQGSESRVRLALAQADMTLTTPQVSFTGGVALIYDLYLNKYRR